MTRGRATLLTAAALASCSSRTNDNRCGVLGFAPPATPRSIQSFRNRQQQQQQQHGRRAPSRTTSTTTITTFATPSDTPTTASTSTTSTSSTSSSSSSEMIALAEEIGALTLTANPSPRGVSCATPEGYGFSSPITRILKSRGADTPGYYAARASTSVIEVMEGINFGDTTAALVFADDDDDLGGGALLGIFTDADYIKLAMGARGVRATSRSRRRLSTRRLTFDKAVEEVPPCSRRSR